MYSKGSGVSDEQGGPIHGARRGPSVNENATAAAVREMFAAVAPRYDLLNHLLSLGLDIRWRRAAVRELGSVLEQAGSRVADLCCGTGDLSFALAARSHGRVWGADFCPPMLALARRKAAARQLPVPFLAADSLSLPFRDESLDAVATAFGFRNLADYGRGLAEMWRVLKPGGVLAILEFSRVRWPLFGPAFRFYFRFILPSIGRLVSGVAGPYSYLPDSVNRFPDQDALAELMRSAGFRNVRYRNLTGGVAALHLGEK